MHSREKSNMNHELKEFNNGDEQDECKARAVVPRVQLVGDAARSQRTAGVVLPKISFADKKSLMAKRIPRDPLVGKKSRKKRRVSQKEGKIEERFCEGKNAIREMRPNSVRQYWTGQPTSLQVNSSTMSRDIDTLSIEIVRRCNEPAVHLPSLLRR